MRVTWLIHMCRSSHSFSMSFCQVTHVAWRIRHDAFIYVAWLIDVRDMTHTYVSQQPLVLYIFACLGTCVTWCIHMCDKTHSYVWRDSLMCDTTHWYVWHDSSICVAAATCSLCLLVTSYVWHDAFTCVTCFMHTGCVWLCHTHTHGVLNAGTGWRRHIGCLKLQVICRKRASNCRALLREMTNKDKAS